MLRRLTKRHHPPRNVPPPRHARLAVVARPKCLRRPTLRWEMPQQQRRSPRLRRRLARLLGLARRLELAKPLLVARVRAPLLRHRLLHPHRLLSPTTMRLTDSLRLTSSGHLEMRKWHRLRPLLIQRSNFRKLLLPLRNNEIPRPLPPQKSSLHTLPRRTLPCSTLRQLNRRRSRLKQTSSP